MMKQEILQILRETVIEQTHKKDFDNEKTRLFGSKGLFDSIDFVRFLVTVEKRVNDVFPCEIIIVDDRALSQENSPFVNLDRLANYIWGLIDENCPRNGN
jgi:acyl carrier protein